LVELPDKISKKNMKNKKFFSHFAFAKRAFAVTSVFVLLGTNLGNLPLARANSPDVIQTPDLHLITDLFREFIYGWTFDAENLTSDFATDFKNAVNAMTASTSSWIVNKSAGVYDTDDGSRGIGIDSGKVIVQKDTDIEGDVTLSPTKNLKVGGKLGVGGTSDPTSTIDVEGGSAFLPAQGTSPDDADFSNSQYSIWFDETTDRFRFKGKKSDGVVFEQEMGEGDPSYGSSGSSPNDAVFVNDVGNVGVGTTSPGQALHIGNGDVSNYTHLDASGAYGYHFRRSRGTESSLADVQEGDDIGHLMGLAYRDGDYRVSSYMNLTTDGAPGADYVPGKIGFYTTAPTGGNPAFRMVIDNEGHVGIGNPDPSKKLDVDGDINFTGDLYRDGGLISFGGDPSYGSSGSSPNDAVFVNDAGNVGIGRESTGAKLDVDGNILSRGEITSNGGAHVLSEKAKKIDIPDIINSKSRYENYNAAMMLDGDDKYFGWNIGPSSTSDPDMSHWDITKNITSPKSQGAIWHKGGSSNYAFGNIRFGVSKEDWYRAETEIMHPNTNTGGGGRHYFILYQWDAEGKGLSADTVMFFPSSMTELAQDLNHGDTEVFFTDVSGFVDYTEPYRRRLSFWQLRGNGEYAYVGNNGAGKQYDEFGYTRDTSKNSLWDVGAIDFVNNKITLNSPWGANKFRDNNAPASIPAGTKVAQGNSGGTYKYLFASVPVVNDGMFHEVNSVWYKGQDLPNVGTTAQLVDGARTLTWNGAVYAAVGGLLNYRNYGNTTFPSNDEVYVGVWGLKKRSGDGVYYDNNGNVGIGTMSPSVKLHVEATGGSNPYPDKLFRAVATGIEYFSVVRNGGDGSTGISISNDTVLLNKSTKGLAVGDGVGWLDVPVNQGDIHMKGNVGIGTTSPSKTLDVDGDINFTGDLYQNGGLVSFGGDPSYGSSGSSPNDAVFVNDAGNVGVGTISPKSPIHVARSGAAVMYLEQTDAPENEKVWYFDAEGGSLYWGVNNDAFNSGTNYAQIHRSGNVVTRFDLMVNAPGGPAMVIKNDGNVGIGVAPSEKLEVAGNAKIHNIMHASGTLATYNNLSSYLKSGGVTGAFVITTNINATDTGVWIDDMDITLYNYTASVQEKINLTFYKYYNGVTSTPSFVNRAYVRAGSINPPIRLAINPSGKVVVIIGDIDSAWSYPQVKVNSVVSNVNSIDRFEDWSIDSVTDLTGYTTMSIMREKDIVVAQSITNRGGYEQVGSVDNVFLGNVGIGTTSPSKTLDVDGDINFTGDLYQDGGLVSFGGGDPSYGSSTSSPDDAVFVDDDGNVGIGTVNPEQILDISDSENEQYVRISSTNTGGVGTFAGYIAERNVGLLSVKINNNGSDPAAIISTEGKATYLPDLRFQVASAGEIMRLETSGNVGIGTTSPSEKLEVDGNIKATAFLQSSDRTLKQNIIPVSSSLDLLFSLQGVHFVWKDTKEKSIGFIAQEVEKYFPELVQTDHNTGLKSVHYDGFIPLLLEKMKQQHQELQQIKAELKETQKRVEKLENKVEILMQAIKNEKK
jgi:hypothetical protein